MLRIRALAAEHEHCNLFNVLCPADSFTDVLPKYADDEAVCGSASASLLVVNRQELHFASTPGCGRTIVIKRCNETAEGAI